MSYIVIESHSDQTFEVDRATYPTTAIVEDNLGFRHLLSDDYSVLVTGWLSAKRLGAVSVIVYDTFECNWSWIDLLVYDERSKRRRGAGRMTPPVPEFWHRRIPKQPTYRDMGLDTSNPHPFVHVHAHSEYCLAPETRVVTADLKWKPIADVVVGEQLVGFDEDLRPPDGERGNSRSKMRRTTVERVKRVVRDCYRITLEDGTQIVASAQHGWVTTGTTRGSLLAPGGDRGGSGAGTRRWLTTEQLLQGRSMPSLVVWAKPWEDDVPDELVREAGWLAGVADGEGWLHEGQFSLGQNPGVVLDEMKRVCKALGYDITEDHIQSSNGACRTFRLRGYEVALRFLAQCRPTRFVDRVDEIWVGRRAGSRYSKPVAVVAVEHLGERETIAIQTSTRTFVAEGFLSHNSALDGMSTINEMIERAQIDDQGALAVTDHGVCAAHVKLAVGAAKFGIKPIFGIEANFVNDRHRRGDPERAKEPEHPDHSRNVLGEYRHLILWAEHNDGLRNLWAMSTAANQADAFYGRPRMDWEIIEQYADGVMCSTACMRGPLAYDLLLDREDRVKATLARLQRIFKDRLWIELGTNHVVDDHGDVVFDQEELNRRLIVLAHEHSIPLVAVVDSHYPCLEDHAAHQVWLAAQTNTDLLDDTGLFNAAEQYPIYTGAEVASELAYLPDSVIDEAMAQTLVIAERAKASIETDIVAPVFAKKGGPKADATRMKKLCREQWERKIGHKPHQEVYEARFKHECQILESKKFCGYFLMVWKYVAWARAQHILVGPGRGSGGGSLIAFLLGITGIDPVESKLMFERFLNPGRNALPDFDIDFPTSKRAILTQYVRDEYGTDNVVRVGTHMRLRNSGVIRKLATVLGNTMDISFVDINAVCEIIKRAEASTAGLGIAWDELWVQHEEDLAPYREKYPVLFGYCDRLVGRLQGYGKHPAGLVISIGEALVDKLPMRIGDDGTPIAEFDFEDFEFIGLPKFDLLTLRTLDTIQMCIDLVRDRYDIDIDPDGWVEEYRDGDVWAMLARGRTLGVFQVETNAGTTLCKEVQPEEMFDLSDIIALDRPGPLRSGLKDQYLRRRYGEEAVDYPDARLEEVLDRTYGCIIYQEDVMATFQRLAGYTLQEADDVRRILGKKKVEAIEAEGESFVNRAVEHDVARKAAQAIFDQIREFAKYSFNRAHSFGYAMLGYWCAWFKYHYPIEFVAAVLSTADPKRIPEFIIEARRMGLEVLPPDINSSKIGFTIVGDTTIRYGLNSVKGVGDIASDAIIAAQPFKSIDDFMERKTSKCNIGVVQTLVRIGALDTLEPNRRALEQWIDGEKSGDNQRCVNIDAMAVGPGGLRCSFDWENEPVELTPTGRRKQRKPPPKKCTKACRQYDPVEGAIPVDLPPYTPQEIRGIEREVLGLYLSSTPFDDIVPGSLDDFAPWKASDLEDADPAQYNIVATVTRVRRWEDRGGNEMAFLTLFAQDGNLDVTCFKTKWKELKRNIQVDDLMLAVVERQSDGRYKLVDAAI